MSSPNHKTNEPTRQRLSNKARSRAIELGHRRPLNDDQWQKKLGNLHMRLSCEVDFVFEQVRVKDQSKAEGEKKKLIVVHEICISIWVVDSR